MRSRDVRGELSCKTRGDIEGGKIGEGVVWGLSKCEEEGTITCMGEEHALVVSSLNLGLCEINFSNGKVFSSKTTFLVTKFFQSFVIHLKPLDTGL